MSLGAFCLVLHGHVPYVLRHGTWPHGEDWLCEAAAETYLPLLEMVNECAGLGAAPNLTLGLTPVLLEQLATDHFRKIFRDYLGHRIRQGREDAKIFSGTGQGHLAVLAEDWAAFYEAQAKSFDRIGGDLPKAFADCARQGLIQIISSSATHACLPLLYEDSCVRAQIRAGLASSTRLLGFTPTGLWLPECAYRPGGPWTPPIPWGGRENRLSVESICADEGVNHFFLEHNLIDSCRSEYFLQGQAWQRVGWDHAGRDPQRGWGSIHEPHGINSEGREAPQVTGIGRDPEVCKQVWSGQIGYPAEGAYLEFHKRQDAKRGLRYWRVTSRHLGLGEKEPYQPQDIPGKIHMQVIHFQNLIKQRLHEHRRKTGRYGMVAACFDAELFGHWWFEGVRFLRDLVLVLQADPEVDLMTTQSLLEAHPPDKVVSVGPGSWGDGGDFSVWANPTVNWTWDVEYRCESRLGRLTGTLDWASRAELRQWLEAAGRELLLLQSSDWTFAITRGQAVDYGIQRFTLHARRCETFLDLAEAAAQSPDGRAHPDEAQAQIVSEARTCDLIFPQVDLAWWKM